MRSKHNILNNYQNCSKQEFNAIFAEKNKDVNETLLKYEHHYKNNFTISVFRHLLELNKDEILREVIKEDYKTHIKNTHHKIMQGLQNMPELNQVILEELNKKYGTRLNISLIETRSPLQKTILVKFI